MIEAKIEGSQIFFSTVFLKLGSACSTRIKKCSTYFLKKTLSVIKIKVKFAHDSQPFSKKALVFDGNKFLVGERGVTAFSFKMGVYTLRI